MRALLAAGADPNAADKDGNTVLMRAAFWGWTAMVMMLLKASASSDAVNRLGATALMSTAVRGTRPARALLEADAEARAAESWRHRDRAGVRRPRHRPGSTSSAAITRSHGGLLCRQRRTMIGQSVTTAFLSLTACSARSVTSRRSMQIEAFLVTLVGDLIAWLHHLRAAAVARSPTYDPCMVSSDTGR